MPIYFLILNEQQFSKYLLTPEACIGSQLPRLLFNQTKVCKHKLWLNLELVHVPRPCDFYVPDLMFLLQPKIWKNSLWGAWMLIVASTFAANHRIKLNSLEVTFTCLKYYYTKHIYKELYLFKKVVAGNCLLKPL